jgi:hypothetical protein
MMRQSRLALLAAALGCALSAAPPAAACSAPPPPPPDYLVRSVPVIVRANAVGFVTKPERVTSGSSSYLTDGVIRFEVREVLKGGSVPSDFTVQGLLSDKDDFNELPVPYKSKRLAGRSGCVADIYREGGEFLMFLGRREGKLILIGWPFAPVNEQLRSADDPWLVWVREYLNTLKAGSATEPAAVPGTRAGVPPVRAQPNARHPADAQ